MTLEQIFYFTEIVKYRSINSASVACHMTYQAMSKSLKNLERELNFTLVERDYSGVSLTYNGERFYNDALTILKMSEGWKQLAEYDKNIKRELSIYATPYFCSTVVESLQESTLSRNYIFASFPCYPEIIPHLLSNSKQKKKSIGLTCYYSGLTEIISFAKEKGYIAEQLSSDKFLAYVNIDCFYYGKDTVELADLKNFRPVIMGSNPNVIQALFSHPGLWQDYITSSSTNNALSIVNNNCNTFHLGGLSYKKAIESMYPNIKGLEINEFNEQIDYYMLYSENISMENKIVLDYIKEYYTKKHTGSPI